MGELSKRQIQDLIDNYGFEEVLIRFNLTEWKVLEILDDLGFIFLEVFEDE